MNEPTPPPERPLPDAARRRIRSELLEHAHDHRSGSPRWVVPASAAAAVALVAGLGYWAINPGEHDASGGPAGRGGGASLSPATDPSTVPSEDPSVPVPADPSTVPSGESSVPASEPPESFQVGTGSCAAELKYVLKGAAETYVFPPGADAGTSAIYVKGDTFSLCDSREGTTTVTHPLPLNPQENVATYRVLSIFPPTSDGYQTIRVAGGPVPSGLEDVFHVAYTFPDGHTQQATTSIDDQGRAWWLMVYRYDDGGGNEMQKPPIEVTVSYSGVQKHYSLEWGVDTCAQANHGC
jgi:hypothetical protein